MTAKESKAVTFYHQELPDRMVAGVALYEGQQEWVKRKDYQSALHAAESLLAEAEREVARLTSCLSQANILIEQFERDWYMACDERDLRLAQRDSLQAELGELRRRVADVLGDLKWRIEDTRETLMSYRTFGSDPNERLYGCDEWSTPTVNLQHAVNIMEAQLKLLASDGGADGDNEGEGK